MRSSLFSLPGAKEKSAIGIRIAVVAKFAAMNALNARKKGAIFFTRAANFACEVRIYGFPPLPLGHQGWVIGKTNTSWLISVKSWVRTAPINFSANHRVGLSSLMIGYN